MRGRTITTRFEIVERRQTVTGRCSTCQKRFGRVFKIWHSINPYNKDENGQVKTRERVTKDVNEAMAAIVGRFQAAPCCARCKPQHEYEGEHGAQTT